MTETDVKAYLTALKGVLKAVQPVVPEKAKTTIDFVSSLLDEDFVVTVLVEVLTKFAK